MKFLKSLLTLLLTFALITVLTGCFSHVPVPKVKEGRFNFSVTYEVDGVVKTHSGVFVCEFAGVTHALDGSFLEWDSYLENGVPEIIKVKETEDGVIYLGLTLNAYYLMADPSLSRDDNLFGADFYIEYNDEKSDELGVYYDNDMSVIEGYGVKLISSHFDEPIENEYT